MELSLDARSLPRRPSNASLIPAPLARAESEGAVARTYLWRSCCVEMDSGTAVLLAALVISLFVLIFCIHEIATLGESQWAQTGTFMIGVWLPSPRAVK